MTIKELKERINDVPDNANVVYQTPNGEHKDLEFYGYLNDKDGGGVDSCKAVCLLSYDDGWITLSDVQ
jgi:hypothetical protein